MILSYGCSLLGRSIHLRMLKLMTAEIFRSASIYFAKFTPRPPILRPCTMMNFPYTYISCPCNDVSTAISTSAKTQDDEEEQERTFDPKSRRANFSLYPLEHLLYCEDCQQIRCPRCTAEEIVCWYCPSCLFEMPLSVLKSEGPR